MIKKLVRLLTDEKLKVKNVLTISKINNLYMKLILIIFTLILISCSPPVDKEALKKEIFNVEKSYQICNITTHFIEQVFRLMSEVKL